MIYTASKLLTIAKGEIGYHEKTTNTNLDKHTAPNDGPGNYTKYARDLHKAGYYNGNKNGFDWCDVFVDWMFWMLCGKDAAVAQQIECQSGPYGAGCYFSAQYYKAAGRWHSKNPQPGDQIFFRNYAHTGVVFAVEGSTITTIEGNTDSQVAYRTYAISDSRIDGYGRPWYDEEETEDKAEASLEAVGVGDVVAILPGATYYSGSAVPRWVAKRHWIVKSIREDRAVIDKSADGKYAICSPIHVKYLQVVEQAAAEPSEPVTVMIDPAREFDRSKAGRYTVKAKAGLHLRAGAGTDNASLEVMANASEVACYGYHTGSWLFVAAPSGKCGYAHGDYLDKEDGT